MERAARILVAEGRGILPDRSHGSMGTQDRVIREVADPVTGEPRMVVGHAKRLGVDDMHAKGRITDRQKDVADRFLSLYARAHSDGMKAIDYSKVKVDCALGDSGADDMKFRAIKELERTEKLLGKRGYEIMVRVAVDGEGLAPIAQHLAVEDGSNARVMQGYVSLRFVEALDQLSDFWDVMVGTGSATRSDAYIKGQVLVDFAKVDRFEGWTTEEIAEYTFQVGEKLKASVRS